MGRKKSLYGLLMLLMTLLLGATNAFAQAGPPCLVEGSWEGKWDGTHPAHFTFACVGNEVTYKYNFTFRDDASGQQYSSSYEGRTAIGPMVRFGTFAFVLGADGNLHGWFARKNKEGKGEVSLITLTGVQSRAMPPPAAGSLNKVWRGDWNGRTDWGSKLTLATTTNKVDIIYEVAREIRESNTLYNNIKFRFDGISGAFVLGPEGQLYGARTFVNRDGQVYLNWVIMQSANPSAASAAAQVQTAQGIAPVQISAPNQTVSVIERPTMKIGEVCSYRKNTEVEAGKPSSTSSQYEQHVVATEADRVVMQVGQGKLQRIVDLDGNPLIHGDITFSPNFLIYKFPIKVGNEWSGTSTLSFKNSPADSVEYRLTAKAVAWEGIQVAAGRFDAIRIEVAGNYVARLNGRQGEGVQKQSIWYAPAVSRMVRADYHETGWNGQIYSKNIEELVACTTR